MAPPAGQAPRIPAIVTNGDTNSRVRKVVCILQNAEYRSAVVSGAYSSLISFPAVKISRFNRERKMHARAVGFDSTLSNASRNAVQNCTSIAFAGSEWSEIIDIDGDAYETPTTIVPSAFLLPATTIGIKVDFSSFDVAFFFFGGRTAVGFVAHRRTQKKNTSLFFFFDPLDILREAFDKNDKNEIKKQVIDESYSTDDDDDDCGGEKRRDRTTPAEKEEDLRGGVNDEVLFFLQRVVVERPDKTTDDE